MCFRCPSLRPALPVKTPIRGRGVSCVLLCWLKDVLTTYAPSTSSWPLEQNKKYIYFSFFPLKTHILCEGLVCWLTDNNHQESSIFTFLSGSVLGCCPQCFRPFARVFLTVIRWCAVPACLPWDSSLNIYRWVNTHPSHIYNGTCSYLSLQIWVHQ